MPSPRPVLIELEKNKLSLYKPHSSFKNDIQKNVDIEETKVECQQTTTVYIDEIVSSIQSDVIAETVLVNDNSTVTEQTVVVEKIDVSEKPKKQRKLKNT